MSQVVEQQVEIAGQTHGDAVKLDADSRHGHLGSADKWLASENSSPSTRSFRPASFGGGVMTARSSRPIARALRRTSNACSTLRLASRRNRSLRSADCSIVS